MISAKQKLLKAILDHDTVGALRIAKDFRVEFNKEQQRSLQIAYESLDPSKKRFYQTIGATPDVHCNYALLILKKYFKENSVEIKAHQLRQGMEYFNGISGSVIEGVDMVNDSDIVVVTLKGGLLNSKTLYLRKNELVKIKTEINLAYPS